MIWLTEHAYSKCSPLWYDTIKLTAEYVFKIPSMALTNAVFSNSVKGWWEMGNFFMEGFFYRVVGS